MQSICKHSEHLNTGYTTIRKIQTVFECITISGDKIHTVLIQYTPTEFCEISYLVMFYDYINVLKADKL